MSYPPHQMVPPPPPPPARAPPAMHQVQQSVNDQQLKQLFQLPQQSPSSNLAPNYGQQSQHITLPANLSEHQITALQTILHQGPNDPRSSQANTNVPAQWHNLQRNVQTPSNQVQPWQQPTLAPATNQAQPTGPLDIMGLAEQAALALSSVPGHQNQSFNVAPIQNRSHQTMNEQNLSQMVQLAIQVSSYINLMLLFFVIILFFV